MQKTFDGIKNELLKNGTYSEKLDHLIISFVDELISYDKANEKVQEHGELYLNEKGLVVKNPYLQLRHDNLQNILKISKMLGFEVKQSTSSAPAKKSSLDGFRSKMEVIKAG